MIRVDYHGSKEVPTGTCRAILKAAGNGGKATMIDLKYSLIIEATEDPDYFGFYSPDLDGFSGAGNSIDDCMKKAQDGMKEHVKLLETEGLPVPPVNPNPTVTVQNSEEVIPAA